MGIKWLHVARDVVLVWVASIVGQAVTRALLQGEVSPFARGITNLLVFFVMFCVCGCLTPTHRWTHLSVVVFGVWLTSAINLHLVGAQVGFWWLGGIPALMIPMGLGGAASYMFVRTPKSPGKEPASDKQQGDSEFPTDDKGRATWVCASCGEQVEEQFAACWNCGAAHDGAPPSDPQPFQKS
jgi:hypothetical protein